MKIYLIRDTDRYKIGFSKEPKKRLKQLQTGSSEVMELVYEVECDNVFMIDGLSFTSANSFNLYRCGEDSCRGVSRITKNGKNLVGVV